MKFYHKISVLGMLIMMLSCTSKSREFDVRDYGAKGDSLHINTLSIQKAINECHKSGGGSVLIKEGVYISGTILLKNNVTLYIDKHAKLVGSSNPKDYQSIDTF